MDTRNVKTTQYILNLSATLLPQSIKLANHYVALAKQKSAIDCGAIDNHVCSWCHSWQIPGVTAKIRVDSSRGKLSELKNLCLRCSTQNVTVKDIGHRIKKSGSEPQRTKRKLEDNEPRRQKAKIRKIDDKLRRLLEKPTTKKTQNTFELSQFLTPFQ